MSQQTDLVTCFLLLFCCLSGAQELLVNPSFENGLLGWKADVFTLTLNTQNVYEGSASALCSGRTQSWQGPAQDVSLTPGGRYEFNVYVKLIDDLLGKGPQPVHVKITTTFTNGTKTILAVATRSKVSFTEHWVHIGGYFQYPKNARTSATLSIDGPAGQVSFYVDAASLVEIPEYLTWEADANLLIDSHRKNNINFRFNVSSNFLAKDLTVQIDHNRHLFGFGSLVDSDFIVRSDYKRYQDVAYYLFNWATIADYTWARDRGLQGSPDFSVALNATDTLITHGLNVRGKSLFSASVEEQPPWVAPLTGQSLKDAVEERIDYITRLTKGRISHWDVNEGHLQGTFFEDRTGDPQYTQHIFQLVHDADSTPDLFLNERAVLVEGSRTLEYLDQINAFFGLNVGMKGAGIQSNFPPNTEPDITLLSARLDRLAQTEVPLWITELSVSTANEQDKADWYERVLRLYFSNPAVEGILLSGFWDHEVEPEQAIVHGFSFTLDEAGKRLVKLLKKEWSTHETRSLSAGSTFTVRGFQGDYSVVVYYKGKPIQRSTFTLWKSDKTVNIEISGFGTEIQLPPVVDPFQPISPMIEASSPNLQTVGQATSTAQTQLLQCVTRWSGESEIGADKTATVSCNTGEVLTGCTSYLKSNDWRRDGEQVTFSNGKAVCMAFNGYHSTVGVQAVARCCSLRNLHCRYRTAGPSSLGERDEVIVPCEGPEYPVGCGTWTFETESAGTLFTSAFCVGVNDGPKAGVYAYASCCQTPNLHCVTMYSEFSGRNVGDRATMFCPAGYGFVVTGCNVYAPNARAAGAFIEAVGGQDACVAVNGFQRYGSENGVQAIATCCRTTV